jgi:uncharacterized membrane protein HdeD (DUF308 family)
MNKFMKRVVRSSIITSILLATLGILLIIESETTVIVISYIIGSVLVLLGTFGIIDYIRKVKTELKSELDLLYALVTIILGVLIILNPKAIASVIPFVLGIIIIVNSSTKLNYAFQLKSQDNQLWKSTLVVSILTTLCGIVLLFNPFAGAVLLARIVGVIILVYALLDIISSLIIRNNVIKIQKALDETTTKEAEVVEEEENKEE